MKNGQNIQLTLWSEDLLVKDSVSQVKEKDSMMLDQNSHCHLLELWKNINRDGFYGRTCPEYYPAIKDLILHVSSIHWLNSGILSLTESLMHNSPEWPKDVVECSLSDILIQPSTNTGVTKQQNWLRKYYLSQKCCQGIIRRAKERGKKLPERLMIALQSVSRNEQEKKVVEKVS